MNRPKTPAEVLEFLKNPLFDVKTPADKGLLISGLRESFDILKEKFPNVRLEKELLSIGDFPDGKTFLLLINNNPSLSGNAVADLTREANYRFIDAAKGNLTVLLAPEKDQRKFLDEEFSRILKNKQITAINHIEAKQFKFALDSDNSQGKEKAKERILNVLLGKDGIEQ